jgi:hypothetical protein
LIAAVLLRGLDVLSTEDSVLQAIKSISSVPIRSIRIGQDPLTNTSRGVCYLEMNHVMDAVYMHNALVANSPIVDGKKGNGLYLQLKCFIMPISLSVYLLASNFSMHCTCEEANFFTVVELPPLFWLLC